MKSQKRFYTNFKQTVVFTICLIGVKTTLAGEARAPLQGVSFEKVKEVVSTTPLFLLQDFEESFFQKARFAKSFVQFEEHLIQTEILRARGNLCKRELQKRAIPVECYFFAKKLWQTKMISKKQYQSFSEQLDEFCKSVSELKVPSSWHKDLKPPKEASLDCQKKAIKAVEIKKYKESGRVLFLSEFLE